MTSILEPGLVNPRGIIFTSKGTTTPIVLPGDGVLVVDMTAAQSYTIANGEALKGVRLVDSDEGDPAPVFVEHQLPDASDDPNCLSEVLIMVRAEPGGIVQLVHDDVAVSAEERLAVSSGGNAWLNENRIQIFAAKRAEGWRVEVPDWSSTATQVAYTPAVPGDWAGDPPSTVGEALDRLAAASPGA